MTWSLSLPNTIQFFVATLRDPETLIKIELQSPSTDSVLDSPTADPCGCGGFRGDGRGESSMDGGVTGRIDEETVDRKQAVNAV